MNAYDAATIVQPLWFPAMPHLMADAEDRIYEAVMSVDQLCPHDRLIIALGAGKAHFAETGDVEGAIAEAARVVRG